MTGLEKKVILRALDQPDNLTEWENDFINNLADKEHITLSQKQSEILLQKIWPKLQREFS